MPLKYEQSNRNEDCYLDTSLSNSIGSRCSGIASHSSTAVVTFAVNEGRLIDATTIQNVLHQNIDS
jgi:hypothetical protein